MGNDVKLNELESMQAYNIIPEPDDAEWPEDGNYVKCRKCGDILYVHALNENRICVDCEFVDDV